MSESKNTQGQKSSSALPVIIAVFVVLVVIIGAGLYASNQKTQEMTKVEKTGAETPAESAKIQEEHVSTKVTEESSEDTAKTASSPTQSQTTKTDTLSQYSARILGNPDAPLKISEHSAFTCGHCKHFHETNFIKIKRDYIDTGKAYLVYNDFPLSKVGMEIGAVARCLPDQVYFNFIQLMFETQNDWKSHDKYVPYIKQNTRMLGLTEEKVEECMNNEDIHQAIASVQQEAHKKFGVESTPTLVLNDEVVVPGLLPYDQLKEKFDALIEKN